MSPAGFVFEVRTRTSKPELGASASVTSDQRRAASSDRRIPAIKEQARDRGVESAAPGGGGRGLDAAPEFAGPVTGSKDGREVVGGERGCSASAAIGGGPAKASQDAGGLLPGRVRVVGQAGAEADGGDGDGRAARGAASVVEDGQVGGEGRVVKRATAAPGVELAEGAAVAVAGVRADGGGDQPPGGGARRGP